MVGTMRVVGLILAAAGLVAVGWYVLTGDMTRGTAEFRPVGQWTPDRLIPLLGGIALASGAILLTVFGAREKR